ncbi:DUF418 domain-containing protein [Novosphingobium colocasiae]|uniref:DUF418 domain-containing protein n=1 Tax=Novosphingobium colocasiae TaxID=1256513 RepID=A0A918PG14_9SPHN|nr:DUF418 domain-containing protein [Novosphingobium colocasiae]GGZ04120.1 hypothetical protein GCM10011614_18890 [Novosphingobium colocasiae]
MPATPADHRLVSLDLVRGVAVLGILAINIAGFAGPRTGVTSPCRLAAPDPCEQTAYAVAFVLFEGKMRALFAALFGAGIALFQDKARRRDGVHAEVLQARRLGWLMVLGLTHYFALWWGDILFVYGACGLTVLALIRSENVPLITLAIMLGLTGFAWTLANDMPAAFAEELVRLGRASPADAETVRGWYVWLAERDDAELTLYRSGFDDIALAKAANEPLWLVSIAVSSCTEIIPLMLGGVLLYRSGLFSGALPRRRLVMAGSIALLLGLALTLGALAWLWPRHFPFIAMAMLLADGLLPAHLLMAFGYLALLVSVAPAAARTAPGRWLIAAGRMAFSNYIATSALMTALFYGWGLGLFGTIGPTRQWLIVGATWLVLTGWSTLWLRHFRRGPLEWLWRCLTEGRWLTNRISA